MPRFIFEVEVLYPDESCQAVHERLQTVLHSGGEWGDGFEARVLGGARQADGRMHAARIEIVEAPGDMCGNTKRLPSGGRCPGCRACS